MRGPSEYDETRYVLWVTGVLSKVSVCVSLSLLLSLCYLIMGKWRRIGIENPWRRSPSVHLATVPNPLLGSGCSQSYRSWISIGHLPHPSIPSSNKINPIQCSLTLSLSLYIRLVLFLWLSVSGSSSAHSGCRYSNNDLHFTYTCVFLVIQPPDLLSSLPVATLWVTEGCLCVCVGRPNIELNTAFLLREYQWSAYGDDLPQERRFRWVRAAAAAVAAAVAATVAVIGAARQQSDRCSCTAAAPSSPTASAI